MRAPYRTRTDVYTAERTIVPDRPSPPSSDVRGYAVFYLPIGGRFNEIIETMPKNETGEKTNTRPITDSRPGDVTNHCDADSRVWEA